MLGVILVCLLPVALSNGRIYDPQLFYALDSNNDGSIGLHEVFEIHNKNDANGDGLVSLEEFAAGTHPGSPPLDVETAFKLFDNMDTRDDGFLDFTAGFNHFKNIDLDNNNEISLEEFKKSYSLAMEADGKQAS